jgi:recombination protein RecT
MLNQAEQTKLRTVTQELVKLKPRFDVCFPKNSRLDSNRLIAMVSAEMRRCPKILDCDRESVQAAVGLAARLMLEPDSALGYFYLIPFGKTLQVIIGYKGMLELAMRSPNLSSLYAQEVYEKDEFSILLGTEKSIHHRPFMGERGKVIGVYAIAQYKSGAQEIEFMSKEEVDAIRKRSKSSGSGPWVTDYAAMARKTVLRRMTKYIPSAIDAHLAIAVDEACERGDLVADYIEVEGECVDTQTGEITQEPAPQPTNIGSSLDSKLGNQK